MTVKENSLLLDLLIKRYPELGKNELYARIMCGEVFVNGERVRSSLRPVPRDADVAFQKRRYVSRGGLKLEAALNYLRIPINGKIMLDAGCSAGGFTDCLLQHGAALVHAVDVGYNQLDYSLRAHPFVMIYEKTNIMTVRQLEPQPYAATADLSFRSIKGAASRILSLTSRKLLIGLIKPQFEYRAGSENFNGVIVDNNLLEEILLSVAFELEREQAFVTDIVASPIKGRKGNREFFFLIQGDTETGTSEEWLRQRVISEIDRDELK